MIPCVVSHATKRNPGKSVNWLFLLVNSLPLCQTSCPLRTVHYFRVIDKAASQLTKTAITVTAIFIVALGYDLWYYLLGYAGATDYKMNTPLQKIGTCYFIFSDRPIKGCSTLLESKLVRQGQGGLVQSGK